MAIERKHELTYKVCNRTITVFGEEHIKDYHIDGDELVEYTDNSIYEDVDSAIKDCELDYYNCLCTYFPEATLESIEDAVHTIMIHASAIINDVWACKEE